MRMDKLTSRFQMALADAQSLAIGQDNNFIEPEHVLKALIVQDGGSIKPLLIKAGVQVNQLIQLLDQAIGKLAKVSGTGGDIHISNNLMKLLNLTDKLSQQRKDQFISSELFLQAVMDENGHLAKLIKQAGGDKTAIDKAVEDLEEMNK